MPEPPPRKRAFIVAREAVPPVPLKEARCFLCRGLGRYSDTRLRLGAGQARSADARLPRAAARRWSAVARRDGGCRGGGCRGGGWRGWTRRRRRIAPRR